MEPRQFHGVDIRSRQVVVLSSRQVGKYDAEFVGRVSGRQGDHSLPCRGVCGAASLSAAIQRSNRPSSGIANKSLRLVYCELRT